MGGDVGAREEDAEEREEEGVTRDDAVRVDSTELERDFLSRLTSSLSCVTRLRFFVDSAEREDVEAFGRAFGGVTFNTGGRSCGGVDALRWTTRVTTLTVVVDDLGFSRMHQVSVDVDVMVLVVIGENSEEEDAVSVRDKEARTARHEKYGCDAVTLT